MKVVILDRITQQAKDYLKLRGLEVEERLGLKGPDLAEAVKEADAVIIRSSSTIDSEVLAAATGLKVIGRAGIGLDNVDLKEATRRGIVVMNTPSASTTTTAELSVAMLLALSRNIPQAVASLRSGAWNRKAFVGREVFGKTAGIVGLGRIGLGVAVRLQRLDMAVIAYDPFVSRETAERYKISLMELDELLAESDYISLHTPATPKTRHLINRESLRHVKPGTMLINCARGALIDEEAVLEALESGKLAGAALDVLQQEPPPPDHPLVRHPNVIVTPHLGASTHEAQQKVSDQVARQVADALLEADYKNAVNLLMVDPETEAKARDYVILASTLASISAQMTLGRPTHLEVELAGVPASLPKGLVLNSCLEAILGRFLQSGMINRVNAGIVAKERGLESREIHTASARPFADRIKVCLRTDRAEKTLAGTVLSSGAIRLVELDGFLLEATPSRYMLISRNLDRPGVIGKLGSLLGRYEINIARMQLGRLDQLEEAVSILNLDSDVDDGLLKEILSIPEILETTLVHLD